MLLQLKIFSRKTMSIDRLEYEHQMRPKNNLYQFPY